MTLPYVVASVTFLIVSIAVWAVFLRPVARHTGRGTVRSRTYFEEGTYWQTHVGVSRGLRTPTPIPIAGGYTFLIELEGSGEEVSCSLSTLESEGYSTGDRVEVEYERRGVAPFWMRVYVLSMRKP